MYRKIKKTIYKINVSFNMGKTIKITPNLGELDFIEKNNSNYLSSQIDIKSIFNGTDPYYLKLTSGVSNSGEEDAVFDGNIAIGIITEDGKWGLGLSSTTLPLETLHVGGRARIDTIDNGIGDFITVSATGVITKRTHAQIIGDLDLGLAHNLDGIVIDDTNKQDNTTLVYKALTNKWEYETSLEIPTLVDNKILSNNGTALQWVDNITPGGISGSVQFNNGAGLFQGSSNFIWDNTNNRLNIGTGLISGYAYYSDFNMVYNGAVSIALDSYSDNNLGSHLNFRKSRGTSSTPNDTSDNDILGSLRFWDYTSGFINKSMIDVSRRGLSSDMLFHFVGSDSVLRTYAKLNELGLAIGTSAAAITQSSTLHVQGSGTTSSTYTAQFHNSTGNNNSLLIRDDGTVSIGTLPISSTRFSIQGLGSTGSTDSMAVLNSSSTQLLRISDSGLLRFGNTGSLAPRIYTASVSSLGAIDTSGTSIGIFVTDTTTNSTGSIFLGGNSMTTTSGGTDHVVIARGFSPTSGNASLTQLNIRPTLNQTGTANGIIRGIHYNPIVTSVLGTHRAIETSIGDILFLGGGRLGIGTIPTEVVSITNNQNTGTLLNIFNSNTGSAAYSGIRVGPAGVGISLNNYLSTYTTFASWAGSGVLSTDISITGGIIFNTANASAPIIFQNSYTEYARFTPTGRLGLGTNNPKGAIEVSGAIGGMGIVINRTSAIGGFYNTGNKIQYGSTSNHPISFMSAGTEIFHIGTNGNSSLGGSDSLTSRFTIYGSGSTSSTSSFVIRNSSSTQLLRIRDNGTLILGIGASIIPTAVSTGGINITGQGLALVTNDAISLGRSLHIKDNNPLITSSGTRNVIELTDIIAPTSGTANFNIITSSNTINTTGTYSGTIRGFYYNPTLTSMTGVTHRAIETNSGDVIFNEGNVGIGTIPISSTRFSIQGASTTTGNALYVSNSTPTLIYRVTNTGRHTINGTWTTTASGDDGWLLNQIITGRATVGDQFNAFDITTQLIASSNNQRMVGMRVKPTFTNGSFTGTDNVIAEFIGNNGTQLIINDNVTGVIYGVNDVSGIPIIEITDTYDFTLYNGILNPIFTASSGLFKFSGSVNAITNYAAATYHNQTIIARSVDHDELYGNRFNNTLIASYSGQSLIGMLIDPVFNTGSYFGVTKTALEIRDGDLKIKNGDIIIDNPGYGIKIKVGTNSKIGTVSLSGGTATVPNTLVTANSKIFLSVSLKDNPGYLSYTKNPGIGFTIDSSNTSDNSIVEWIIIDAI